MYALSAVLAALGIGFALGLGGGGFAVWGFNDWQEAREERAIAAKQIELATANAKARTVIEDGITARKQAFDEGVAVGKAQGKRVSAKVAEVTKGAGFNNPQCVAGPEAFALYKAALGAVTGGKIPDALLTAAPVPAPVPAQPAQVPPAVGLAPPRPPPHNPLTQ